MRASSTPSASDPSFRSRFFPVTPRGPGRLRGTAGGRSEGGEGRRARDRGGEKERARDKSLEETESHKGRQTESMEGNEKIKRGRRLRGVGRRRGVVWGERNAKRGMGHGTTESGETGQSRGRGCEGSSPSKVGSGGRGDRCELVPDRKTGHPHDPRRGSPYHLPRRFGMFISESDIPPGVRSGRIILFAWDTGDRVGDNKLNVTVYQKCGEVQSPEDPV